MYIADRNDHRIRRIAVNGIITTVVGTGAGTANFGDNGPATSCTLYQTWGVGLDLVGNLLFHDAYGYTIHKVDATTGIVTRYVGKLI